ncbi:hypothetical protein [Glycomyces sp. NPDC047010]|uniref:hypothetical protein n=1 Tax=Glycomyces sp. NPDC047010 TaxID=3155023 RepID=UPI0033CBE459
MDDDFDADEGGPHYLVEAFPQWRIHTGDDRRRSQRREPETHHGMTDEGRRQRNA